MKKSFENILKTIDDLPDNKRLFIIKNLKHINTHITILTEKSNMAVSKATGLPIKDNFKYFIPKAVELLKVFGFTELNYYAIYDDFLEWFIEETSKNPKFNPKTMTYELLLNMQIAWMLSESKNFNDVKKLMISFSGEENEIERKEKMKLKNLIDLADGSR